MNITIRNHTPYFTRPLLGGGQALFRFANGYGASVISHAGSYGGTEGLFELAVIKFSGPGDHDWSLCYDTPITDDVIGHLTIDEVRNLLDQIEALPEASA